MDSTLEGNSASYTTNMQRGSFQLPDVKESPVRGWNGWTKTYAWTSWEKEYAQAATL